MTSTPAWPQGDYKRGVFGHSSLIQRNTPPDRISQTGPLTIPDGRRPWPTIALTKRRNVLISSNWEAEHRDAFPHKEIGSRSGAPWACDGRRRQRLVCWSTGRDQHRGADDPGFPVADDDGGGRRVLPRNRHPAAALSSRGGHR